MKIGVAQIKPVKGDIEKNIARHLSMIHAAAACGAEAIFFPELSLTGYEPRLAASLATSGDDQRLGVLRETSGLCRITIGAGMPLRAKDGIQIVMIIFQPGKPTVTYAKQQLHPDEFPYFIQGSDQVLMNIGGVLVAPAICFESLQQDHAANAVGAGAALYLASVAKSKAGVQKAMKHYPGIAQQYDMPVLMANCVGPCDNYESWGNSGAWTRQGMPAGHFDERSEGIIVFDTGAGLVIEKRLIS